jgi:hypothetical protein
MSAAGFRDALGDNSEGAHDVMRHGLTSKTEFG